MFQKNAKIKDWPDPRTVQTVNINHDAAMGLNDIENILVHWCNEQNPFMLNLFDRLKRPQPNSFMPFLDFHNCAWKEFNDQVGKHYSQSRLIHPKLQFSDFTFKHYLEFIELEPLISQKGIHQHNFWIRSSLDIKNNLLQPNKLKDEFQKYAYVVAYSDPVSFINKIDTMFSDIFCPHALISPLNKRRLLLSLLEWTLEHRDGDLGHTLNTLDKHHNKYLNMGKNFHAYVHCITQNWLGFSKEQAGFFADILINPDMPDAVQAKNIEWLKDRYLKHQPTAQKRIRYMPLPSRPSF